MLAGVVQHDVMPLGLPRRCEMQRLEAARLGKGQTMFDLIVEIIGGNSDYVQLRLE